MPKLKSGLKLTTDSLLRGRKHDFWKNILNACLYENNKHVFFFKKSQVGQKPILF